MLVICLVKQKQQRQRRRQQRQRPQRRRRQQRQQRQQWQQRQQNKFATNLHFSHWFLWDRPHQTWRKLPSKWPPISATFLGEQPLLPFATPVILDIAQWQDTHTQTHACMENNWLSCAAIKRAQIPQSCPGRAARLDVCGSSSSGGSWMPAEAPDAEKSSWLLTHFLLNKGQTSF